MKNIMVAGFVLIGALAAQVAGEDLQGRMETFALNGPVSGMEAEVKVYLPPAYDSSKGLFPVMYFLHGSGGASGINILAGYAEKAVRENICRPFVIVELRGPNTPQCWWVDAIAVDSKAGTLVSQDLLQAVESRYRVMKKRAGRIIAGFSMGGFGAMAQLFQHPVLFATGVAYDGGFPDDGQYWYKKESLRERIERLFGADKEAFEQVTPAGRAAQYVKLPADLRLPVDYQLLIGAFGDRIELFQWKLAQIGAGLPGRVIGTPTRHNLGNVLESCWREHFRFLEQRMGPLAATAGSLSGPADPWEDPALQAGIDERIEKHRKGDASLVLRDIDGAPIEDAAVRIEMKRHFFSFGGGPQLFIGGGTFGNGLEATYSMRAPDYPHSKKHYEKLTRLFNHGTVPIPWQYIQRGQDAYDLRVVDEALAMHQRFGISLEVHPLYWPIAFDFPPVPKTRENRLAYWNVLNRALKGKACMWNVINESLRKWGKPEQQVTLDEEVSWAFREADKIFGPDTKLSINELTPIAHDLPDDGGPNAYHQLVTRMLDAGCRIDAIGFQFHAYPGIVKDPHKLLRVYESFASFNKPLYISEASLPKSADRARTMRNLYRLWFSLPQIENITYWFWQLSHNRENLESVYNKGLMDEEMEPLDGTYAALDDLINREWHTAFDGKTDDQGRISFRGFYGTYEAAIVRNGGTKIVEFDLKPDDTADTELVFLP